MTSKTFEFLQRNMDALSTGEWLASIGVETLPLIRVEAKKAGVPYVYPIEPNTMYIGALYVRMSRHRLYSDGRPKQSRIIELLPVPDTQTRSSYEICMAMRKQDAALRDQFKR